MLRHSSSHLETNSSDDENYNEEQNFKINNLSVFPKREKPNLQLTDTNNSISQEMFLQFKQFLTCSICFEIFQDPVYIKQCSHRFCKNCIERCIRSKLKACPFCRKKVPTKRVLRQDYNLLEMIQTIFGNLKDYKNKEQQKNDQEFYELYKIDNFIQESNYKRKYKSHQSLEKQGSMQKLVKIEVTGDKSQDDICQELDFTDEKQETIVKKRKVQAEDDQQSKQPEEVKAKKRNYKRKLSNSDSKKQEIKLDKPQNNEEDSLSLLDEDEINSPLDQKNHVFSLIQGLERNELSNFNFLITVQLKVHPNDFFTKQIEKNIIRVQSGIVIRMLKDLICQKLNLNKKKHIDNLRMYLKEKGQYIQLSDHDVLSEINQNYFNQFLDFQYYDTANFFDEVINRNKIQLDKAERVLYYEYPIII